MSASRLFASVYTVFALGMAALSHEGASTSSWVGVCCAAAGLAFWAVLRRPPTLACAAHAGLAITWAGSLAPRALRLGVWEGAQVADSSQTVIALVALTVGMAVLVAIGLTSAPRAGAHTSPLR